MRTRESDLTAGLGDNTIPPGYPEKKHGVGTAVQVGPNPDAVLNAETAAITPNGIDPLNKGYSIGGDNDPLAEYEKATDNPGIPIGGGKPSKPLNSPGHPAMSSMEFKEEDDIQENDITTEGIPMQNNYPMKNGYSMSNSIPFGENDPFIEDDLYDENAILNNGFSIQNSARQRNSSSFGENDITLEADNVFEAIPEFIDPACDPALATLPVAPDGVIEPVVVPDVITDPDLGPIPDVALPLEEPIVEITEDDTDIQIPENIFETDKGIPESIPVQESFKLPEEQSIVVTKGDQIFLLGKVREDLQPKWAKPAFIRACESLCGNLKGKEVIIESKDNVPRKVASFGRSLIVEVAKDWRLPGTNTIFEAHDLLQIVSSKPLIEKTEDELKKENEDKKENDQKKETDKAKEAEEEKLKKEAYFAWKRWRESKAKNENDKEEDEIEEDDPIEAEKKKEKAKKERAMYERMRTGGWL